MVFHSSICYIGDKLTTDAVPVEDIAAAAGTPVYIYSLERIRENYRRIQFAFAPLNARLHFSVKSNGCLAILRCLRELGAGFDCVSAGEIALALAAGARGQDIVFAGVGKTRAEIDFAIDSGIGFFNVENALELLHINEAAQAAYVNRVRVALRLNPQVTANTHPYMATGHGGAKFGLTAERIEELLALRADYPRIDFAGLHMHIGSQLGDSAATREALDKLLDLARGYPGLRTINLGGGLPVAYRADEEAPPLQEFVDALSPGFGDYEILLEPGRAIAADAGLLAAQVLYVKRQAGQLFYIIDASMSELIRPALYGAYHEVAPLRMADAEMEMAQVVGPVCESADVLARDRLLPRLREGDMLALMTAGAYGMAMASNYNARPRPAEVVVDGGRWLVARRREGVKDMVSL